MLSSGDQASNYMFDQLEQLGSRKRRSSLREKGTWGRDLSEGWCMVLENSIEMTGSKQLAV